MTRHFEGSYGGADIFNFSRMSDHPHHVSSEQPKVAPHGVAGAPNEAVLLQLMERTGYTMLQENGQRKYGGPPPGWEGPAPLRGCEVFVGKIPRDCYEDELVPVFEKVGRIYELRLMMDFSGSNRGYCFVMYTSKDDARRAVKDLNNFEIRKGRFLGVCLSVDNCRLFVGGIPKNKQRDEILGEMVKVTEGVVDVIVYPSATDKSKNRGFAFVEFESHKAAAMARRKLIPGRIQLWGHPIAVDWAEPEQEVDEDIMCKVKILYVRNLMLSTTEDTIREIFTKAVEKNNCVERVKKIRDYAFVHLREREDALKALKAMDGQLIENSQVEVCLAKPVDKTEYVRFSRGGNRGGYAGVRMSPTDAELKTGEALLEGYGSLGYGDQQAGFPYYQQLGMATASAALGGRGFSARPQVSPLSPGGQMGGSPRGRGRGAAGMRGTGGRSYLSGVRNTNYKKRSTDEPRLYDLTPDMVLTPTNPLTLKPQSVTSYVQVLEDMCQKNGWGQPMYQLNSTLGQDANGDMQLFLYKVSVPALPGLHQTNKLCRTVDEAKQFAAENVLRQLNIPMDAGGDGSTMALANGQASAYGQLAATASVGRTPPANLYSMSNASLSSAISSYPSTLASVPLTNSYVVSPPRTAHTMTQLNGHGDMAGFDAFNFSALAASAPMGYAPQYHP